MARNRILAIIQAGGAGSRMDVLTRERAKPALPFAGVYQLVDFPLSNLYHSGIDDVWLSVQYQTASLDEEVANGRPWDLDRDRGGFRLLTPQQGTGSPDEDGFAAGNADVLFRVRDQVAAAEPELLLVLSADHVYRFDYTDAIATHRAKGADCTIVTSEVARAEASNHATVRSNRQGRVTDFSYKPKRPTTRTVAAEVFVYSPEALFAELDVLHHELTTSTALGDSGLGDFGEHLLPRLVERGKVYEHPMRGYWRDLGRPESYLAAHRDLLTQDVGLFADPAWPIMTRQPQRSPARVHAGARIEDSLVSPGCQVRGVVRRSVLGPGVVVDEGARISDSVVFADAVVCAGATVEWAIVDSGSRVERGAKLGARNPEGLLEPDRIAIVGRDSTIASGARVPAGARLEPGTSA
ncbi:MAG: NTP transferase domain-containing protein [Nocardioidaceae bacterium]|nr:NTP transferase domain-containing protein [Nocardioidaceae bacterium]